MSNKTTVSSVSRTRRIALTILGSATVLAGGLALAPHAGAAQNPTAKPAAVAVAQHTDNGEINTQGQATKGFIIKNNTDKHFHLTSMQFNKFENPLAIGTDLAPGHEYRWEMFWQLWGDSAWVTYAADDGTAFGVTMHNDTGNQGSVTDSDITTPTGAKPVHHEIGYDYNTSAWTITIKN